MTEDHPFNNKNFYGATKISSSYGRAFHDRYGLNYVGLRYMNVYGPRQDQKAAYNGVIPTLLDKIDNDQPLIVDRWISILWFYRRTGCVLDVIF